jgi:hypothetical protein
VVVFLLFIGSLSLCSFFFFFNDLGFLGDLSCNTQQMVIWLT